MRVLASRSIVGGLFKSCVHDNFMLIELNYSLPCDTTILVRLSKIIESLSFAFNNEPIGVKQLYVYDNICMNALE